MNGLRSAAELAANRPHGIRLQYMAGCRCLKCRMANSNYQTLRDRARKAGDWNGLVDASEARAHILKLGKQGVGYKTVAQAAGVSKTILARVRTGERLQVRARFSRAVLAVTKDMAAPHSLVKAGELWRRIERLLGQGFTKADLARRLGYSNHALQFRRDLVTVASDRAVAVLYRRLMP